MYTEKHVNLLIECLKDDKTIDRGGHALTEAEWKELVGLATRQCVASILFKTMEAHPDQIPHEVLRELRTTYFKYAARGFMLYHEFTKIFEILQKDGIPFIVLKGADLGETVYGDVALRPISDLDLLIQQKDIPRMTEVLGRMEYTMDPSNIPDRAGHHLRPFLKKGTVPVEVHWDIDGQRISSADQMEGLWGRARSGRIGGVNVLVLSREDMLLHLSLHAGYHHFSLKLISLCDIHEILQRYTDEIAWDQLLEMAGQWKATKALFLTLRLAQDLLTAKVPPRVLCALTPPDFHDQYLSFAKEEIFAERKFITESLAQMYTARKMRDRLNIAARRFFPSKEQLHLIYPSLKSDRTGFYYLKRILGLYGKYGPILCRMLFTRKEGLLLPDDKRNKALHNWLYDNPPRYPPVVY